MGSYQQSAPNFNDNKNDTSFMSATQTSMWEYEDALDVELGGNEDMLDEAQKAIIEK